MHMLSKHKQKEHYRLDMESMMYATVIDSNQAEGILVTNPVRNVVKTYEHSMQTCQSIKPKLYL